MKDEYYLIESHLQPLHVGGGIHPCKRIAHAAPRPSTVDSKTCLLAWAGFLGRVVD